MPKAVRTAGLDLSVSGAEDPMGDSLTDGQLRALRNLADKRAGNITAFVNIADARLLTELGLAARSRQGWDITSEGLAHLAVADRPSHDHGSSVMDLHLVRDPEGDAD